MYQGLIQIFSRGVAKWCMVDLFIRNSERGIKYLYSAKEAVAGQFTIPYIRTYVAIYVQL